MKSIQILDDDGRFLRGRRRVPRRGGHTIVVVDLFAGCGGLTLGVEEAARHLGFDVDIGLVAERDPTVARVFVDNFPVPADRIAGDVRQRFDMLPGRALSRTERATAGQVGRRVDLLVGGPPCQGHSTLNNRTRGDDPKNALYLAMVRAAEVLTPRAILIENVPAIERDSRGVVERGRERLERLGYHVRTGIVSVDRIGVPQLRKRHVLLAGADEGPDLDNAIDSARVRSLRTLRWAIGDLRGRRTTAMDEAGLLTAENRRRAQYLLRTGLYDLPNRLRPPCQRSDHKYKSMYGRLSWDLPAQTITTGFGSPGQGRYFHPDEPRTLTPHEAARLQFFPDWFDFSALTHRRALARVIGNAVPPKLAFVLAHHLLSMQSVRALRPPAEKRHAGCRVA